MLSNQKRVNVSINQETMDLLKEVRDKLSGELGFSLTYAQTIQHLINAQIKTPSLNVHTQGEANE
jgi:predicted RNase H-related nuclease YkuK (DUF458 family)